MYSISLHRVWIVKYRYTKKESAIPNIEETDSTTGEMYDKRNEINGSTIPKSTISKADNIQSELITFVFKDI